MNIIIIDKKGDIKESKIKSPEEIYKKCGFKSPKDFEHQTTWTVDCGTENVDVRLYAKTTGRANSENKYEFPPPVDNELYFGSVALLAFSQDDEILDLYSETWEKMYEDLYGGFEDLGEEDSSEEDELEDVPDEFKTKEGYLKDGFVVPDDNDLEDVMNEVDIIEYEGECEDDADEEDETDEDSELSEDKYYYSDDEL